MVAEGVTSFKLFMAYRGVLMLDDGSIFRALSCGPPRTAGRSACTPRTATSSTCSCAAPWPQRQTAPKYHALTRPPRAEAEATYRAICLAEIAGVPIYIVHLSAAEALEKVTEARDRGLPAYAETCPQYLFLSYANYEEPGFDGAKYVMSPPLREQGNEEKLWRGPRRQRPAGRLDGPLPLLHEGAEGAGQGRLLEDPQRRPGHRDAAAPPLRRRRAERTDLAQPFRRADVHVAGEDLRPLPEEGHDRAGLRRRHRDLRPGPEAHAVGQDPPPPTWTTTPTRDAR